MTRLPSKFLRFVPSKTIAENRTRERHINAIVAYQELRRRVKPGGLPCDQTPPIHDVWCGEERIVVHEMHKGFRNLRDIVVVKAQEIRQLAVKINGIPENCTVFRSQLSFRSPGIPI